MENEFYCLKLMAAFGLPVNAAKMRRFGKTRALVIESFDRTWTADGRLLRIPQEDCCQAQSIPSGFPETIHAAVQRGFKERLGRCASFSRELE